MITSISDDFTRTHRRGGVNPLQMAYGQLNEFIDNLNEKIINRLQLVQQVYLDDYKQQIQKMSQQLSTLRANFDAEMMQHRLNEKLFVLEEERDFFRAQVLKLNQEVNQYVEQNKGLKKKIADIQVEISNYKVISFSMNENYQKKVLKLQKEINQMAEFKRQSSVPILPKFTPKQSQPLKSMNETPLQRSLINQNSQQDVQMTVNSHVNYLEKNPVQKIRAKTFSKVETATKASVKRYEENNDRFQFIDECIKDVKKQIFYRTHQQLKGLNYLPIQEFGKVNFQKFTRTDKRQLIQALMSSQRILEQFSQFIQSKNPNTAMSRMVRTKLGDDKYNEKFLNDLKRSFSKKIYDLKTNPDSVRGSERKKY